MTIHDLKKMLSFEVNLYRPENPLTYVYQRLNREKVSNPLTGFQESLLSRWIFKTYGEPTN